MSKLDELIMSVAAATTPNRSLPFITTGIDFKQLANPPKAARISSVPRDENHLNYNPRT